MFQQLGLVTEILWRRSPADKGMSASIIRQKMAVNEEWRHMVPPAVARLVDHLDLRQRVVAVLAK